MTFAQIGPFYATVISQLALTTADPELTKLGIEACRAATRDRDGDETDRPVHSFNLMLLLHQRFELTGAGLEESGG